MRCLFIGLLMSMVVLGVAFAQDAPAETGAEFSVSHTEVTGLPLYRGPVYKTLDSQEADITVGESFHSFMHLPVDEVGYSPLTLEDFRYPVPGRTNSEFSFERLQYPEQSMVVWHDDCKNFTVTAFFFTRDMIRDHIQRMIDEYYICEPDMVQQIIDFYAEVTPQCGEAISWVWFNVDEKGHHIGDLGPNRYFERYLYNMKDKFYLEFGLPKAQTKVDESMQDFLYQYENRPKYACGPEFKERICGCDKCEGRNDSVKSCAVNADGDCKSCPTYDCNDCPESFSRAADEALYCDHFNYKGFDLNVNDHYQYYPRKVLIEDMTYDWVARGYRWKFAWRFTDCEIDWLRQMCGYGQEVEFALVLSDPHWYAKAEMEKGLERDILAAMDPQTWGNVWPAGNVPFDTECCECLLPNCDGNCQMQPAVGWAWEEPAPLPEFTPPPAAPAFEPPQTDFEYFPPEETEPVAEVEGRG